MLKYCSVHLLEMEECDLLMEDYLKDLGFPQKIQELVGILKNNLQAMARKVDKLYPKLSDFFTEEPYSFCYIYS